MELNDDLEYREERLEFRTPIKKNIPLKLRSSSISNPNSINLTIQKPSIANQNNFDPNLNSINHLNPQLISPNNKQSNSLKNYPMLTDMSSNDGFIPRRNHLISNLNWNMNVNKTSEKEIDKPMDFCMLCNLPILIYGRLIPCKHVMCYQCATNIEFKFCPKEKCHDNIERIEPSIRGKIFICNYDLDFVNSSTNSEIFRTQPEISQKKLCGRSYMSQRDLMAHIKHRHDPNLETNIYDMQ